MNRGTAWRRGNWLTTGALLAITIGFVTLVFLPQMREIQSLRDEIRAQEAFIAQEPLLASQLELARRDLAATEEFVAAWVEIAPDGREKTTLQGRITGLARGEGISVTRLEPGQERVLECLRRMPLEVGAQGAFGQLFSWLVELESLPVTIWVNELTLERMDENGGDLRCEANLEVFADNPGFSD